MKVRTPLCAAMIVVTIGACDAPGVVEQRSIAGADAERGRRRIVALGCGACHAIDGVPGATGRVGPSLADLANRTFLAGSLRNEPLALMRWIRDPQAMQPGTAMPDLGVTVEDARDIAAYLYTRQGDRLGPSRLLSPRILTGH